MYPVLRKKLSEGLPEFYNPMSVKDGFGELISFNHAREFSSSLNQATTVLSEGLSNNIVYRYVNDEPGYSENASFNKARQPSIYLDIAEDTTIVSEQALQSDFVSVKHEPWTLGESASFGSVCDPTFSYGEETSILSQQSHHIVPVNHELFTQENVSANQPSSSIVEETFAEWLKEFHNIASVKEESSTSEDTISNSPVSQPFDCITQHTTKLPEGLRKTQNSVFIKEEPLTPEENQNGGDRAIRPYPVTLYQVTPKFRESADRSHYLSVVNTPDPIEIEDQSSGKHMQEHSQSQRYPFCEFAGIEVDKLTKLESSRKVIGRDKLLNGTVLELFTLKLPLTWLRDCLAVWLGDRIVELRGLKSQQRSYIMSQLDFLWINYNQKKDSDNQQEFMQFLNTPFAMSQRITSSNMSTRAISDNDPLEHIQEDSAKRKAEQDSRHCGSKFPKGSSEFSEQYPFCKLAGIDVGSLLKWHDSCPHVIDQEKLLNGAIIELSEVKIQLDRLIRCLSAWLGDRYPFLKLGRIPNSERLYILSQFDILGKKHEEKKRLNSPKILQDFLNQPFRLHAPKNTSRHQATEIGKHDGRLQSTWNDDGFPERSDGEGVRAVHSANRKIKRKKAQIPCRGRGTDFDTFENSSRLIAPKTPQVMQKIQKIQELKEFFASKHSLQSIQELFSGNMKTRKTSASLLEEYRSVTLPYIISNWKIMAGNTDVHQIHNRCTGLNLLAACNDQVSVTLKLYEDFFYQIHNVIRVGLTESQVVSLIQTICQAFAPGGSTLFGVPEALSAFLRERGLRCQWSPGDHINSLFDNAGALYYHHRHLIEFLEGFQGKRNYLLSEALLKNDLLISGCRALGLVGKFFTGPFYVYAHLQNNCSLLQMSAHYGRLIANLKTCTMKDFLDGSFSICCCLTRPQKDVVLEALVSPNGTDAVTELILAQLLEDIGNLFERLLQGQLAKQFVVDRNGRRSSVGVFCFGLDPSVGQVVESASAVSDPGYHILKNFAKTAHWFFGMNRKDRRHTLSERSTLRKMSLEQFKEKHRAVIA